MSLNVDIINEVPTSQKVVAFTFDDGPNPLYTPQLLDIFSEVSGRATFFMIGEMIEQHSEVAAAVHAHNHEIGNHTYSHPFMTQISIDQCENELLRTERLITQITGAPPSVMRPPYLDYNEDVHAITSKFGYHAIGALNLGTRDWEMPGVDHILNVTRRNVKNGSILIFHDGYEDRSQTIEAVRILTRELSDQGYQFVTVSELLNMKDTD
ncbi:polysaccharide deacetylase family protein [Paenibacillus sinopodophylli]|uniref:polysaccharide deacetylase family protein n=1 Tax=Paenibacillus sinopodophylli TaxID=1837342 RepID=UPI00110CA599|nr:polysaccharide deacetylase family protein [Paenibacillus sinopodophylli]